MTVIFSALSHSVPTNAGDAERIVARAWRQVAGQHARDEADDQRGKRLISPEAARRFARRRLACSLLNAAS